MKKVLDFLKLILVKTILLIQFIKHKILKKNFTKDNLEILKHKLNFYSYNLKKRKILKINNEYNNGKDINENIFKVDINKFTGFDGYYTFNGQAPLLKSAIQICKNPNLNVNESYLYKFYRDFQPKNYGELYNLNVKNSLYNLPSELQFKPWVNTFVDTKKIRKAIFGPCGFKEVEHRLIRLKNIFKNVIEFGYAPSEKDIIKGYILRSKDDYRFLITSGHHRVAVLKAINYLYPKKFNKVTVAFEESRSNLKYIDQENVDNWPAVTQKYCSRKDALELFSKFFKV